MAKFWGPFSRNALVEAAAPFMAAVSFDTRHSAVDPDV
jgi:hypothetical protein